MFCGTGYFWSTNLTWATLEPGFTPCFEFMVLPILLIVLCLTSLPYLYFLYNTTSLMHTSHHWILPVSKIVCIVMTVVFLVVQAFLDMQASENLRIFPLICLLVVLVLSVSVVVLERRRGIVSSGVHFMAVFSLWIFAIVILVNENSHPEARHKVSIAVQYAAIVPATVSLVLANIPDCKGCKTNEICPEETCSFVARLWFIWVLPLVVYGYKAQEGLKQTDLYAIHSSLFCREQLPPFQENLERRLYPARRTSTRRHGRRATSETDSNRPHGSGDCRPHEEAVPLNPRGENDGAAGAGANSVALPAVAVRQPGAGDGGVRDERRRRAGCCDTMLARSLLMTFRWPLLLSLVLKLCADAMLLAGPQILKNIIMFMERPDEPAWHGYFYALALLVTSWSHTIFLGQYFRVLHKVGMGMKTCLISTVYRKAFRLSVASRKGSSRGAIVNLMAVDAAKFLDFMVYAHNLWSSPLQIAVVLSMLWALLGPAVFAGFAIMLVLIPLNAAIAKRTRDLTMETMRHKDHRVKLISEMLDGIKVLKLYAWEKAFGRTIEGVREKEIRMMRNTSLLHISQGFSWSCAPLVVSVTTFAVYVSASPENTLNAEKVFVALSLFNILRFPLMMFPMIIASFIQVSENAVYKSIGPRLSLVVP